VATKRNIIAGKINANQRDGRLALTQTNGNETIQAQRFFDSFTV